MGDDATVLLTEVSMAVVEHGAEELRVGLGNERGVGANALGECGVLLQTQTELAEVARLCSHDVAVTSDLRPRFGGPGRLCRRRARLSL